MPPQNAISIHFGKMVICAGKKKKKKAHAKSAFLNFRLENSNLRWQNGNLPWQNDFSLLLFSFITSFNSK